MPYKCKTMITTHNTDNRLFEEYILVSLVACIVISIAEVKLFRMKRGKVAKRREWMPGIVFFPMLLIKWLLIPFRRHPIEHNKYPQGHFHYEQNKPHSLHRQNAFDMYA